MEEHFELLIKNGSTMSSFTQFINIDKLIYIVRRPIHKSNGNLKTGFHICIHYDCDAS